MFMKIEFKDKFLLLKDKHFNISFLTSILS